MTGERRQQRVVAEGWGSQGSGSVFCADSSLRYIYESQSKPLAPGSTAAAITSLAATDAKHSSLQKSQHGLYQTSLYAPLDSKLSAYPSAKPLDAYGGAGRGANGVDHFEAEIAKACAMITKQVPSLPHSFRECSVCLTQNAHAQINVCGHTFHSKCFLRWFRTNRSCPLCRGPVDKIQLAPVLSVQDELEAIMAEMDDDHVPLGGVTDPLMENPELISFLSADFDTDMDMMPLEDLTTLHEAPSMETEDVSMEEDEPVVIKQQTKPVVAPLAPTVASHVPPPQPPMMQFAPTSTMPDYWNVLNQGMGMPAVAPTTPAGPLHHHHHHRPPHHVHHQPTLQQQQRMVHIAPKPDGHTHFHSAGAQMYTQPHIAPAHHHHHQFAVRPKTPVAAPAPVAPPRVVSCRCTGGCRNGRCACVKEGGMCGAACRCTSCKNPFLMVKAAGADIDALLKDACFMHNVSKTRDMVVRMQEAVFVPCCETTIRVIDCVQGYTCRSCDRTFDFSWCTNKLLDQDKTPRNHCEICKRCCDHRDVHCHDCGRCYFAGVAASLPCPCKESSRKRRDQYNASDANGKDEGLSTTGSSSGSDAGDEEKEGECSIM